MGYHSPLFNPIIPLKRNPLKRFDGFTLSELLIGIAVLGLIATFTIPKVLYATQSKQMNSITKELASAMVQAVMAEEAETGPINVNTNLMTLMDKRLNSIGRDTTSVIDSQPNSWTSQLDCGNSDFTCWRFQNGAVILMDTDSNIPGTSANDAYGFFLDPDGKKSEFRSVSFFVYADHAIKTRTQLKNPTYGEYGNNSYYTALPEVGSDPSWFSWN